MFLLLSAKAIFLTSKVRFLTLEALVVSKLEHGPLLQIIVEIISRIQQARIFIQPFVFNSLKRLLLHIFLEFCNFDSQRVNLRTVGCINLDTLTRRAVRKLEYDSGREPPNLQNFHDAVQVEDMPTRQQNTRLLSQAL